MARNKLTQTFEREDNFTLTENLAVTHQSTLNKVLDFYYHAPTRQGQDNLPLFVDAYNEDRGLALKALFYLRDIIQWLASILEPIREELKTLQ